MSKSFRSLLLVFAALVVTSQAFTTSAAQDIEVTIEIRDDTPGVAYISGRFLDAAMAQNRNLSLRRSLAGNERLGERFSGISLTDVDGLTVPFLTAAPGEYVANSPFVAWTYKVDLANKGTPIGAARTSWLTAEKGLLILSDVLPQLGTGRSKIVVQSKLRLPKDWTVFSDLSDKNLFIADINTANIYVGKTLRLWPIYSGGRRLNLIRDGEWNFTDDELAAVLREIYARHVLEFGSDSNKDVQVAIFRSPPSTPTGVWEGVTRGRNITLVSSDMPFKSQSLQRLHEQLRHEVFHLWIPEGVNLTGNYDWFYEGFALYQSLKLGVAVNRLRFEDYLDSLSQAIAIDRRLGGKISLIEASKNRWSGDNNSVVYARGMLVAFMCDLAMLEASKGKRSTDDLVREVYRRHSGEAKEQDGNTAVLELMRSNKELAPLVERYVTGVEKLDMTTLLNAAGIESADGITLKTVAKPNSRQKKILDKLGYNNWRKLSSTRK